MTDPPRITFVSPEEAAAEWCPAGHKVSSGARWRCHLPPGHPGQHDDNVGTRWDDPPPPERIVAALTAAGFVRHGGKAGAYDRMGWPEHTTGGTVWVPLDPSMEDYDDLYGALVRELEDAAAQGEVARKALTALGKEVAS